MKHGTKEGWKVMSSSKDISFFVEQKVLDIGVKIVFAVVEGIDNKPGTIELE